MNVLCLNREEKLLKICMGIHILFQENVFLLILFNFTHLTILTKPISYTWRLNHHCNTNSSYTVFSHTRIFD